jgi:hypothetical protein
MSEKKVRLFDKLVNGEAYDEAMLPLIEEEAKANFHASIREGQIMSLNFQKEIWEEMDENPSGFDLNSIADKKLKVEAIKKKIEVFKELYKELFDEEIV